MLRLNVAAFLVSSGILSGCVSISEINRANYAIDAAWQKGTEAILHDDGTRYYPVSKDQAFRAIVAALQSFDMLIDGRDENSGIIRASSIAPRPLNGEEWAAVEAVELPKMREIIAREIGPMSSALFILTPDEYRLVFVAAVDGSSRSAKIGMTALLRRINSPLPGTYWPKHMPPTAAKVGIAKLWSAFEQELQRRNLPAKKIDGLDPVRNGSKGNWAGELASRVCRGMVAEAVREESFPTRSAHE